MRIEYGKQDWQYNAEAAKEEAANRVSQLIANADQELVAEIIFSDLAALQRFPDNFFELTRLKRLHLGRHFGAGGMYFGAKELEVADLSGLKNLEYLNLDRLKFTDLKFLKGLTDLRTLTLNDASVKSAEGISGLMNLQYLSLNSASISEFSKVKDLPNLKVLSLHQAKIDDFRSLRSFSRLVKLDLSGTQIDTLEGFEGLRDLQELEIERTAVSDLSPLSGAEAIIHINFARSNVVDANPLKSMLKLTSINLNNTKVRDLHFIKSIPKFSCLEGEYLSFSGAYPAIHDLNLKRLSLLPPHQCAIEVVDYLNQASVEPVKSDHRPNKSLETLLRRNSPIEIKEVFGLAEAVNTSAPPKIAPNEKAARIRALREHVDALILESRAKQIPAEILERLKRYRGPFEDDEPLFILLDGPMAFLKGSLSDKFLLEEIAYATDRGFVAAIKQLCVMHDQLSPFLMPEEEDEVPELRGDITEQDGQNLIEETLNVLHEEEVSKKFGVSVLEAVEAARDYFRIASSRPGSLKVGFKALGGILATLASSTTILTWSATPQGAAVLLKLRNILEKLLSFFPI